ncbi:tryptophan--tRNA ligase [Starmerella bacillaris]|uniref:tryptophan--tRNA ligase n=1 Tax=Starmerella bacillaris TaxID=1247836 RepID=A0AAV5RQ15_STABA|nr:tryptophan--tRNA ligase [Starmerella bacillaris]
MRFNMRLQAQSKDLNRIIMSGIQPSGVFHLGNILGAVSMWNQLTISEPKSSKFMFMIADLHSLTSFKPPNVLRDLRIEALASILACNIDPVRCNIYFQSQAPAHSELHWILSSLTSMGSLSRMVQWKTKSGLDPSSSLSNLASNSPVGKVGLGLFSYPVLQAADVLINQATLVPVGIDQAQHLELARHLARVFNFKYGDVFAEPETLLAPCKRVLSLRNPDKKMSKSDPDKNSCIYLSDSEDTINRKLKLAVTDSISGQITELDESRTGVVNLVTIAAALLHIEPIDFIRTYRPASHLALKTIVAEVVNEYLKPVRTEYDRLLRDKEYLETLANAGAEEARNRTNGVIANVKNAIGL